MAKIMSKKSFVEDNISMRAQSPLHLTEGQKACLRLVVQHQTSKEIARTLGISPFTVDQRLDAARRKLNATSRKEAAKLFATLDQGGIYQPFVYETPMLESADDAVSQNSLPEEWRWSKRAVDDHPNVKVVERRRRVIFRADWSGIGRP
jgi:DNA-binding CsgD family transcriptional regulator